MTRWAQSTGQFCSPPLLTADGNRATSSEEKIALLRATHLPLNCADLDLPPPALGTNTERWLPITDDEIDNAFKGARNTAAGADNVPLGAITSAWPHIRGHVKDFFNSCLSAGWYP
jgi:hypothetical protein